jgi:hypothetical protein
VQGDNTEGTKIGVVGISGRMSGNTTCGTRWPTTRDKGEGKATLSLIGGNLNPLLQYRKEVVLLAEPSLTAPKVLNAACRKGLGGFTRAVRNGGT